MNKLKVLELFGGIGACSKALKNLSIDYEIADYVEIDKYAVKSFNAIFETNFDPQDICEWNKQIDVDLIMHGSPCQDFSLAGKQAGGDEGSGTRSSLMYETIRIVEKLKPKYVIWENVKNVISKKHRHNFDNYLNKMEELGYKNYWQVLNAKDYGIPQNRERVFTISVLGNESFEFPPKQELKLKLKDMLEDEVDEKYYLSDELIKNIKYNKETKTNEVVRKYGIFDDDKSTHQAGSVYDENGLSPTLDTMQGGWRQPCIEIKNATKKGYQEAIDGDDINLSYPTSNTRRGRVGKQVSQTIQCNDAMGVVLNRIDVKQKVKVRKYKVDIENLKKTLKEHKKYSNKEISEKLNVPITTVEHWFRNDKCFSIPDANIWHKLKELLNIQTNEFDESIITFIEKENVYEKSNRCYFDDGIAPTLTSTSSDEKIILNSKSKDKRLKKLVEKTEFEEGKVLNMDLYNQTTNENISQCLTEPHHNSQRLYDGLRIRKLTPKECWRLMGFDDEDFEKAEKVNSNTQLYKQAGNSIVVNVLMEIFKELL